MLCATRPLFVALVHSMVHITYIIITLFKVSILQLHVPSTFNMFVYNIFRNSYFITGRYYSVIHLFRTIRMFLILCRFVGLHPLIIVPPFFFYRFINWFSLCFESFWLFCLNEIVRYSLLLYYYILLDNLLIRCILYLREEYQTLCPVGQYNAVDFSIQSNK